MVSMKKMDNESKKRELTKKIESVDTKDLEDELLSKNMDNISVTFANDENKFLNKVTREEFSTYITDMIKQKGFKIIDVIYKADLGESNGRHIIGGQTNCRNRDTILRICIATELDLTETNRALKLCNMAPLYAKNKRDAIIIVAINNKNYDIFKINDLLAENNLDLLEKNIED